MPKVRLPRLLVVVSVACFLLFIFSASRSFAATTVDIQVGGEVTGGAFAPGGVVWFNGYDPATIVIHPGDTVVWHAAGGVHTVTSTATNPNGTFVFDSSPVFTTAGALDDMGPGKLLPPGSVYDLDTSTLPVGLYTYMCRIHPGMLGHLNVTLGAVTSPVVNVVAGWGDHEYAVQAFAPSNLSVPQGTIVRWTLLNPMEPHTITGYNSTGAKVWDSSPLFNPPGPPPVMLPGNTFTYTFNAAGTFTYFCKVHAYKIGNSWVGMVGTVHVVPLTTLDALNSSVNGLGGIAYAALGVSILALIVAIIGVMRGMRAPKPGP